MKSSLRLISGIPLLLSMSSPALVLADIDPSEKIETLVVTATLAPKSLKEVPGSVEVIDANSIRRSGAENLSDMLEQATALDLDLVPGRGLIPQIRGLTNKRVLVMIDGMRFSTGFRDTSFDLSEFPAEIVERIEIVRGPTSALYGSDAIGGVVNIITKRAPEAAQASVGLQYGATGDGDGDTGVAKGFFGNSWGDFGVSLAGQLSEGDMWDRSEEDNFTDFDDEERRSLMLNMHYWLQENHTLSAGFFYAQTNRQGIRPKYGLHWDRDADSERNSAFVRYDGTFNETSLMARVYYSNYDSDRSYIDTGAPYSNPRQRNIADKQPDREDFAIENELTQVELQASRWFADNHRVTLGLEHRKEERSGIENRGEAEVNASVDNTAVFLQDHFSIGENLKVIAGLRFDDQDDYGSELNPRLGMVYFLNDNLRIKGSYGQGFRAPSVYELYVYTENNRGDVIPNEDLEAETATTFELGLEGESGSFTGGITLFHNTIEDMIGREETGNFRVAGGRQVLEYIRVNLDEATTQGVELRASQDLANGFSLEGNASYVDAENKDTGETLVGVPKTKVFVKLTFDRPENGWHANLRATHFGEQHSNSNITEDAYALWSVYVEKSFPQRFDIYAGINNLTDEDVDFRPEKGRFFYVGASYDF